MVKTIYTMVKTIYTMVKTIYTREEKLSNLYTANIISRTIRSEATYIINTVIQR